MSSQQTAPESIRAALAEIESTIPTILEALQVPGIAVSVFKDGEQLLHRGFGTRIAGRDDTPVDTDTLFNLCSITKQITAAAIARLVHDGKLQWTDPITKHMPQWQFSDPNLTKSITIVDLLSHRTGLAGHDEMQCGLLGTMTAGHRDPAVYLPHLVAGDQFRSSLHYSNMSFALATLVIEQLSGQAYPDFVAEHIFDPLGIKDYEWCYRAYAAHPNAARPHIVKESTADADLDQFARDVIYGPAESLEERKRKIMKGAESPAQALDMCKANPLEMRTYRGFPDDQRDMAGAATLYISTNDVLKWAQCLLNEGKAPDGTQVVHELGMLTKVHNAEWYAPEAKAMVGAPRLLGYGLGMILRQFGEHEIWSHDGGSPGIRTRLLVLPRANLAIYLAANASQALTPALSHWILHAVLPRAPGGYPALYGRDQVLNDLPKLKLGLHLELAREIKQLVGATWPVPKDQLPALACDAMDLAGTYHHPGYGYATVLADAHTGEMRLARAQNELDTLYRVTTTDVDDLEDVFGEDCGLEAGGLAFFTFSDMALRVRFVKDESVKDTRPLPKRKAGFAWREKCKYDLVMVEESCDLDIVFKRVDW